MAFVLRDGVAYLHTNDFIGQAVNGLHDTLIAAGWTLAEAISVTVGATDRVYFSAGVSGFEAIWLRVTQTTANDIDLRLYSFWNTGVGYHEAGNVLGGSRLTGIGAPLVGWIAADLNGVGIVLRTAVGVYRKAYAGNLTRMIAPQFAGQTAISNGGLGAASGQPNIKVGSTSGFTAGQDIWLSNQDPGANAGNVERKTILSITPVTSIITLTANLTNAYDDGALVAMDPQPAIVWGSGATETFAAGNRYALHHADSYPGGILAPFSQNTYLEGVVALTDYNPDDFGQFPLEQFLLYDATAGRKWLRGHVGRFVRAVTGGAFADEMVIDVGADIYMLTQETDGSWVALKKTA